MTDLTKLAKRMFKRIEWQDTLETVSIDDLNEMLAEAIRELYVHIGNGEDEIEDKFIYEGDGEDSGEDGDEAQADQPVAPSGGETQEDGEEAEDTEEPEPEPTPMWFEDDLRPDEKLWVILTAVLGFYRKVQSQYDGLTSYTTDAMAVTHGDKPFANLQQKIVDAEANRDKIWYKMIRFHHL